MEPRMYRAEPSLVMNAERSEPKLPLCPSCARNMRLIRRTQRFGTLPDVCTFECRGCGVCHFEEHEPAKPSGALISNDKENAAPNPSPANDAHQGGFDPKLDDWERLFERTGFTFRKLLWG